MEFNVRGGSRGRRSYRRGRGGGGCMLPIISSIVVIIFIAFLIAGCGTSNTKTTQDNQPTISQSQSAQPVIQPQKQDKKGPGPNGETIKGNINSKGEKIYHMPGGAFYERTKPERWFKTEQEAQAAGFRPSKR